MNIVEEFKKIRDIPYRIPLALGEQDDCCSGKSEKLLKVFQDNGYQARYRVCSFRWSDIRLPEDIAKVPHEDDCTHTYLEVLIGDTWKIVDPTWDKGLQKILPVNEWDGKSNTQIAVPVQEIFSAERSRELEEYYESRGGMAEDLRKNGAFYKVFNEWLDRVRTQTL